MKHCLAQFFLLRCMRSGRDPPIRIPTHNKVTEVLNFQLTACSQGGCPSGWSIHRIYSSVWFVWRPCVSKGSSNIGTQDFHGPAKAFRTRFRTSHVLKFAHVFIELPFPLSKDMPCMYCRLYQIRTICQNSSIIHTKGFQKTDHQVVKVLLELLRSLPKGKNLSTVGDAASLCGIPVCPRTCEAKMWSLTPTHLFTIIQWEMNKIDPTMQSWR